MADSRIFGGGRTRGLIALGTAIGFSAAAVVMWLVTARTIPMPEPGTSASSSAPALEPTPTASVLGQEFTPAPTPVPTTEPPPKAVEPERAPARTCRRSTDERCGDLYWDPAPSENRPLVLELEIEPEEPRAGEPVIFTVHARDPDAQPGCCFVSYDREPTPTHVDCFDERRGAWPPPKRDGGKRSFRFEHVFEESGTHEAIFYAWSGDECRAHPYGNRASIQAEFVVWPAPSPSESPAG